MASQFERAMEHVGSYASAHTRERLFAALVELRDLAYVAARDQGNVNYREALERTAVRFDAQAHSLMGLERAS